MSFPWAAKLFFTGRIPSLHFVRVIPSRFPANPFSQPAQRNGGALPQPSRQRHRAKSPDAIASAATRSGSVPHNHIFLTRPLGSPRAAVNRKTHLSSIFLIEFSLGCKPLLYSPHSIPSFRSRDSVSLPGQAIRSVSQRNETVVRSRIQAASTTAPNHPTPLPARPGLPRAVARRLLRSGVTFGVSPEWRLDKNLYSS